MSAKLPNESRDRSHGAARRWDLAQTKLTKARAVFEAALRELNDARTALLLDLGSKPNGVTPREAQVLALVRDHWQNKEIAQELNIDVRTVKMHVSNLIRKFGIDSRHKL
jgi:DNA-binding NarL/FixJ family response regulator